MNWMEFASSIVSSLSWPACVFLVVLFLRRGLINMLTSGPLKALKAGPSGFEMEYFDRTLAEAKVNVGLPVEKPRRGWLHRDGRRIWTRDSGAVDLEYGEIANLRRVAEISPSSAILEGFAQLEKRLRDKLAPVLHHYTRVKQRKKPLSELVGIAAIEGVLSEEESLSVAELNLLRNSLAHGEGRDKVDKQRALAFLDVVDRLTTRIESATLRDPAVPRSGGTTQGSQNL